MERETDFHEEYEREMREEQWGDDETPDDTDIDCAFRSEEDVNSMFFKRY